MKNQKRLRVIFVVGARPNFMKAAPLIIEIAKHSDKFIWTLLHTGQHYDEEMSRLLFDDLALPKPDVYLGVGSGTHAEQTAKIMIKFDKVCATENPDLIIVFGDVNSTLACALVAAKLCIPLAHVEAGLRSFDTTMPEEVNRVVTDHLSHYLFTTCEDADNNLISEGIDRDKIFFVGNTMIDSLFNHKERAKDSIILDKLELRKDDRIRKYALVTLHRPSNVDEPEVLERILNALHTIADHIPVIFSVHPRTKSRLQTRISKVIEVPPLGYLDFLSLMSEASIVLTDSGGIQEETTVLGVPCLTLRNNTERPITVREGTNILVGNDFIKIMNAVLDILVNGNPEINDIKFWDGKAAERIIGVLNG